MSVRGPNNVGRVVQTDPTLLRYASAITEQKKCWVLLAENFDSPCQRGIYLPRKMKVEPDLS